MTERKYVYISFTGSFVIHALLCGFYLYLYQMRKTKNMILLENIELMEIESDAPVVQVIPKQTPPKTVLDFIKMVLPTYCSPVLK